jgi:hypothetical protein
MVLGIILFLTGRIQNSRSSAQASNGSVAVGHDNSGSINNINLGSPDKGHAGAHKITLIAIAVEFIGIGVTLWHAFHLATK